MQRPDFITQQDIERWDENINKDPDIPEKLKHQPIIREVMYAGLWLGEQLTQLGCNPLLITRIQYTAGSLSFGRNPWPVMSEILEAFKNNDLEFEIDYDADARIN